MLIFALAKYQAMKIYFLKSNLFKQKNIYREPQELWQMFLHSKQYANMVADIKYQSKLSYYIIQKIYSQQQNNFQFYYGQCNEKLLKTIKKIFTNDIKDIQDFQIVFQLIQGMVQMILNLVQQEILTGQCEKSKLLCCTYLLYVALYEEAYKFNKNNQMTFVEITANVEKYGYEQLTKNLNNQILNYNKVQTQKRQRR